MEKTAQVRFEVYNYQINIILTSSIYTARAKRSKVLGPHAYAPGVVGMHSWNSQKFQSFIFFTPESTAGTIAHECSHCIWHIFQSVGAEFEDEIFAYHLGYLVDKCMDLQQKHNQKPKKS